MENRQSTVFIKFISYKKYTIVYKKILSAFNYQTIATTLNISTHGFSYLITYSHKQKQQLVVV